MTTDEVTALRKEFEDAILTACTDFKRVTGLSVLQIDVRHIHHHPIRMNGPTALVAGVDIKLESL